MAMTYEREGLLLPERKTPQVDSDLSESLRVAREAAQKKTDTLLLRVLKGTDGNGGAYLKDIVYLQGHVANWLTAASSGPDAISDGDLGKFDINNARHNDALRAVGLLPGQG
jgi:hypothetical protein